MPVPQRGHQGIDILARVEVSALVALLEELPDGVVVLVGHRE